MRSTTRGLRGPGIYGPPVQTTVVQDGTTVTTCIPPAASTTTSIEPPPTSEPSASSTPPATQSCHATCHFLFASYSVLIGVPYNGSDCDNTYNILENGGAGISNWQCVNGDGGNTQLWFNSGVGNSLIINNSLEAAYPSVNGFNCPDC